MISAAAGLSGAVDRHFWERFGAALLVSVIDGAVQAAVQSSNNGAGTVIYNPSGSQSVMTEVLKGTINIAPTVTKQQGDRIQVSSRAISIFGRFMSCDPTPAAASLHADSSALALTLRALRPLLGRSRGHGTLHQPAGGGVSGDPIRMAPRGARVRRISTGANGSPNSWRTPRSRAIDECSLAAVGQPAEWRAVSIVIPPATSAGCVAITIRRPSDQVWSIEELALRGIFRQTSKSGSAIEQTETELLGLLAAREFEDFHALAARAQADSRPRPDGSGKRPGPRP